MKTTAKSLEETIEFAAELGFERHENHVLLPLGQIAHHEYGVAINVEKCEEWDRGGIAYHVPTYVRDTKAKGQINFGQPVRCYTVNEVVHTFELGDDKFLSEVKRKKEHYAVATGLMLAFKNKDYGALDSSFIGFVYKGILGILPREIAREVLNAKCDELVDKYSEVDTLGLPDARDIKGYLAARIFVYSSIAAEKHIAVADSALCLAARFLLHTKSEELEKFGVMHFMYAMGNPYFSEDKRPQQKQFIQLASKIKDDSIRNSLALEEISTALEFPDLDFVENLFALIHRSDSKPNALGDEIVLSITEKMLVAGKYEGVSKLKNVIGKTVQLSDERVQAIAEKILEAGRYENLMSLKNAIGKNVDEFICRGAVQALHSHNVTYFEALAECISDEAMLKKLLLENAVMYLSVSGMPEAATVLELNGLKESDVNTIRWYWHAKLALKKGDTARFVKNMRNIKDDGIWRALQSELIQRITSSLSVDGFATDGLIGMIQDPTIRDEINFVRAQHAAINGSPYLVTYWSRQISDSKLRDDLAVSEAKREFDKGGRNGFLRLAELISNPETKDKLYVFVSGEALAKSEAEWATKFAEKISSPELKTAAQKRILEIFRYVPEQTAAGTTQKPHKQGLLSTIRKRLIG